MEVKKAGKYQMRNGELCEVYGFDDLGTGHMLAEGFLVNGRSMKHWEPETGKLSTVWGKTESPEQYDIVARAALERIK